jgi:hypothetical protein
VLLSAALGGCGEVAELADCVNICEKYRTCVDADYDTAACATRCEDQSDFDASYEQKARECESCVNARSCSMMFPCSTECAGIVP